MNHRTDLAHALSLAGFAVVSAMGCNTLLANEEGTPRLLAEDAAVPVLPEAGPTGDAGGETCDTAKGNKVCFGLCVRTDDPNTGCGAPSCEACDPKNVVATRCKGGANAFSCAYDSCRPGFDSCDGKQANGCETSLDQKDSCGGCAKTCDVPTPFCAATNGAAGCVSACPTGTVDCSGACVDTVTSVQNCGRCGFKCERASATAACRGGLCAFTCVAGTHACGSACASDIDPMYCGASCTSCPSLGPNTIPTCAAGTCGSRCADGYLDCDGVASNGCEVQGKLCTSPPVVSCSGASAVCAKGQQCCNNQCIDAQTLCNVKPLPLPQQ